MGETRTILLTGGTGFLGSHLLKKLISHDFRVILLARPSSNTSRIDEILDKIILWNIDQAGLETLFCNNRIETIIHCATNYGRVEADLMALLEANLVLPLKLLELGNKNQVSCFINTDTILDRAVSYYSLSKAQFREWLKAYSSRMTLINVALEHFYGPFDDETKFVTYIIRSLLNKVETIDLTKGEQKRDFIYIEDVVEAFLTIIHHSPSLKGGFLNFEIGTNHSIEIREFVALVKRLTKNDSTNLNFGALPCREKEPMECHVDASEILKLGWSPKFSLEEGLQKTIDLEKAGRYS
jgi:CDP-paratose synthetase